MMCIDNPESCRGIVCVAPAEGEKPLNMMTDCNLRQCLTQTSSHTVMVHLAVSVINHTS